MFSSNISMLQKVANALGELLNEMVFVGGAVTELYASIPGTSDIRPTLDVDCVIELSSRTEHAKLENKLRAKGFANDITRGAPICRWIYDHTLVDVMPSNSEILGFSNKWYVGGIESKIVKSLPDGTEIFVFPPSYYLAAKLEAHKDRGGEDLRQSHDFEDIVFIMDNCFELLEDINNSNITVKSYLKQECKELLQYHYLLEGIESALPFGSESDSTEKIQELIKNISEIL